MTKLFLLGLLGSIAIANENTVTAPISPEPKIPNPTSPPAVVSPGNSYANPIPPPRPPQLAKKRSLRARTHQRT